MQASIIDQLHELVVFAEGGDAAVISAPVATAHTQLTPAAVGGSASLALRSPLLPPLSPPPADAEVAALEAEVEAAARRVAEMRSSMQAQLQEQLAAKLAACRPSAELEPAAAGAAAHELQGQQQHSAGNAGQVGAAPEQHTQAGERQADEAAATEEQQGGTAEACQEQPEEQPVGADGTPAEQQQQAHQAEAAAPPIPLSPQPGELQQRLASAADRMPALRARLEAATDRLQRVLAAVAADINRPPPNTVEKAVLGRTPGRPTATSEPAAGGENDEPHVSPLMQQVGQGRAGWASGRGSSAHATQLQCTADAIDGPHLGSVPVQLAGLVMYAAVPPAHLQAMESGQISMRRRVARDMQPVPFPQPE